MRQTRRWPIMLAQLIVVMAIALGLVLGAPRYVPALLDGPGPPMAIATVSAVPAAQQTEEAIQQVVYRAFSDACATVIVAHHAGGALCPSPTQAH